MSQENNRTRKGTNFRDVDLGLVGHQKRVPPPFFFVYSISIGEINLKFNLGLRWLSGEMLAWDAWIQMLLHQQRCALFSCLLTHVEAHIPPFKTQQSSQPQVDITLFLL